MAELIKISELPDEDGALNSQTRLPAVTGGQTVGITLGQIADFVAPEAYVVVTRPLPANTASGSGTILTANANGAMSNVDDIFIQDGDTILVAGESNKANNGLYVVTSRGAGGSPWVLTRVSVDYTRVLRVLVRAGTSFAGSLWQLPWAFVTPGTTDQNWTITEIQPRVAPTFTSSGSSLQGVSALNYTIPEGFMVQVTMWATGRESATPKRFSIGKLAMYWRDVGSNAQDMSKTTISKSPDSGTVPFETDTDWDADIVRSTNALSFQVKQDGESPGAKWDVRVQIVAIPIPS
jgi:hypothetical protein